MKKWLFAPILAMLMASLACSLFPTTPGDIQSGEVLFQDDFSDPASGWDRVNVSDGITDYQEGIYRILVNTANTDVWSNPGLDFADVRVNVEATKVGGNDNNDYGLICRYQDNDNFYFFIISSDGYYGIGKVLDGDQMLIGTDAMPPSEVIAQGNATNRLRADCIGEHLSLYVNDQQLASYEDPDFSQGDVGLMAGSFDSSGTDIHFDNFMVLKP